ncbi:hypothetical protein [Acinetobacter baretiae]|uniref:hypothetical protein n=1 Tax=Acinetobacter baretiae TaxID=2605383 RepID=UPI001F301BA3|nr:hypothetical protein [Acinetobacter baretiae]
MSKNSFTQNTILSYLPLKKFHILPIYGLEPDLIKQSAKSTLRDREKISYCTLLNALVSGLGFKGGFSNFIKEYEQVLKPFLYENELKQYANLIQPRYPSNCLNLEHKRQDLSESLFFDRIHTPKKIFTGYNFHYDKYFDDGIGNYNFNIKGKFGLQQEPWDDCCSSNVDLALQNPTRQIPLRNGNETRSLIDIVIGADFPFIKDGFNLLGDQLVQPKNKASVFQLYNNDKTSLNEALFHCNKKMNLFSQRIEEINKGWVEILPFNENIIFLKGENGEYDFIFKNQRDEEFDHQIYAPYLKRADIPKFEDEYHFNRWLYFDFKGFKQKELHQAELEYNFSRGTSPMKSYPRKFELLKKHLHDDYKKTLKTPKISKKLSGFYNVKFKNNQTLMISSLISISDFQDFLDANNSYQKDRIAQTSPKGDLDNLSSVNADEDTNLPVSVTWYDVLAYINWFNREHQIEARLLSFEEYNEISPFAQTRNENSGLTIFPQQFYTIENGVRTPIGEPNQEFESNCLSFHQENGAKISGHPPYMAEESFQNLKLKFTDIKYVEKHDLQYVDSKFFSEWLDRQTSVISKTLTGFYNYTAVLKPSLTSTGKYKGRKTGFRICYELNDE